MSAAPRPTVYTVALAKGGSTKTTTAAELVYALAVTRGRRLLALDLDQQGNLTTRAATLGRDRRCRSRRAQG